MRDIAAATDDGTLPVSSPQKKNQTARQRVDAAQLDPESIRRVVRPLFRRRNDYSSKTLDELGDELCKFGIATVKDLRLLMKRHRRSLLIEENMRMKRAEALYLAHEARFPGVDTFANKSWLAIPGLIRGALELEFGEEAAIYVADAPD